MISGIPPLVGNRGALPHVIGGDVADGGGGRVLPIPAWMTRQTTRLPSEQEIEPWYDAVCELWDDAERYSEDVSRGKHVDYFTSLTAGHDPLAERP